MRYWAFGFILTLFLALTQTQAKADDCAEYRMHLASAKRAFIDAEVYRQEDDDNLAKVSYKAAVHELDLGDRYGKPDKCLPMTAFNEFLALSFKQIAWHFFYPTTYYSAKEAAVQYNHMRKILNASTPQQGRDAYESMKRSVRDMQNVVIAYTKNDKDMADAGIDPPNGPGPAAALPVLGATPAAAPANHQPECTDTPAHVISVVAPVTPVEAQQQGITGQVQVRVELDKTGTVLSATIQKSASKMLENSALLSARNTTYAPEIKNCKPVGGSYIFIVEFDQAPPSPSPTHRAASMLQHSLQFSLRRVPL